MAALGMSIFPSLCLAASAGVISHKLVFIHGEHHIQAPMLLVSFSVLSMILFLSQLRDFNNNLQRAVGATSLIVMAYCTSLFTSIILYRTLFHQLHRFPGPFMAKVTKLWHMWKILDSKNHVFMEDMHRRYGDFVRIGPNELVVFRAEAVQAFHGVGSQCNKAAMYDILLPKTSLSTTRDISFHDQRRRVWDRGFSTKALHGYEKTVTGFTEQLIDQIATSTGKAINVTSWFYFYSFDIIGELAFGNSFDMLKHGESHPAIDVLRKGISLLGPLTPVPWLARVGFSIPGVIQNWKTMIQWSGEQLKQRLKISTERLNLTSGLIEVSQGTSTMERDQNLLIGDAFTILIAGSDTVTSTMTFLFHHLALDPTQAEKLRSELKDLHMPHDPKCLLTLPHLNGIINETLRLHPPVPTNSLRTTPREGLVVAGQHIPGNTIVSVPSYCLGRLERYYERAEEFIPERWYSKPYLVKDSAAFAPFSKGRYRCIGKELALMELRSVAASLVSEFDICFASGEDGIRVWKDMKDYFTAHPGDLKLAFRRRNGNGKGEF